MGDLAFAWDIDLSRRQKYLRRKEASVPTVQVKEPDFFSKVFPVTPRSEIVILNTENGFVPSTVRVRKGGTYTIYIVNVNKKQKNVSFVLDSFSQHHGTYYGKTKHFIIKPKKEGIYSYQSPETSFEGRLVVFGGEDSTTERGLASEER